MSLETQNPQTTEQSAVGTSSETGNERKVPLWKKLVAIGTSALVLVGIGAVARGMSSSAPEGVPSTSAPANPDTQKGEQEPQEASLTLVATPEELAGMTEKERIQLMQIPLSISENEVPVEFARRLATIENVGTSMTEVDAWLDSTTTPGTVADLRDHFLKLRRPLYIALLNTKNVDTTTQTSDAVIEAQRAAAVCWAKHQQAEVADYARNIAVTQNNGPADFVIRRWDTISPETIRRLNDVDTDFATRRGVTVPYADVSNRMSIIDLRQDKASNSWTYEGVSGEEA